MGTPSQGRLLCGASWNRTLLLQLKDEACSDSDYAFINVCSSKVAGRRTGARGCSASSLRSSSSGVSPQRNSLWSTSARFSADSFTAQALWVDSFTAQSAQRQTLSPQPAPSSTSCSASTSQLLPLALGTSQMISLVGYRPSEGKFRSGNNISSLRDAPFWKVTMETAPAEQEAAIKGRPEKRLSASRAFPVRQPGGDEEVGDKGQGKEKSGNKKSESNFEHRGEEETKNHKPAPAIRNPCIRIIRIHPSIGRSVRGFL